MTRPGLEPAPPIMLGLSIGFHTLPSWTEVTQIHEGHADSQCTTGVLIVVFLTDEFVGLVMMRIFLFPLL